MVDRPGMYRKDGVIYKVQIAVHGSGRPYAKRLLEGGGFDIARGMVSKLQPSDMMTLEEAKAYGALYGVCCVCGALLTDEDSIAAGIGPVCAKKGGYFAANPVGLYQDDVTDDEKLETAKEFSHPIALQPAPRSIELGSNQYGPMFVLRWEFSDPDFNAIKDEVKGWSWDATKRRWDPDLKAWTADAKSKLAIETVIGFAVKREFALAPEVEAIRAERQAEIDAYMDEMDRRIAVLENRAVARNFSELQAKMAAC